MTNVITSFNCNQFIPPKEKSILKLKSILYWGVNILTLGFYAPTAALGQKHIIRRMSLAEENLNKQAGKLIAEWSALKGDLTHLLKEWESLSESDQKNSNIKEKISELTRKKNQLSRERIQAKVEVKLSFAEVALRIISYVGQLVANILTVGLYGVYLNNALQNRIAHLKAKNIFIQEYYELQKVDQLNHLERTIQLANKYITVKEDGDSANRALNGIKHTEPAQAYFAEQKAKQDFASLHKDYQMLQNNLTAVKADKIAVEEAKIKIEKENGAHRAAWQAAHNQEMAIKKEKEEIEKEVKQLKEGELKKKQDLANLQSQLKAKVEQAAGLQKEITEIKAQQNNVLNATQASKLGPIPPQFGPSPKKLTVPGAMDIEDEEYKNSLDRAKRQYFEEYNHRYSKHKFSEQVVSEGFKYAYASLINKAESGNMIKLNRSPDAIETQGAVAVYSYMVLDLLRGGKVVDNGCEGYILKINDTLSLIPSKAEKVLQNKDGEKKLIVHYGQKDDFTPSEKISESVGVYNGVNAVEAKWILEELSEQEKEYLFTHLMSSLIEDSHPDYQKMAAFMKNKNDSRVKLVARASELIQDIGTVIGRKFKKTILLEAWADSTGNGYGEIKPFEKAQDLTSKKMVEELGMAEVIKVSDKVIAWELDPDIIGDKRANDQKPRQPEFFKLIKAAKQNYAIISNAVGKIDILLSQEKPNEKFKKLNFEKLNKQFHISHQMIDADFFGKGGERCLFSNLLAILIGNKKELTSDNVNHLKKAMANYLDTLLKARKEWELELNKAPHLQSKDAPLLKEKAELAKQFESLNQGTHNCKISAYQSWLRKESFGAANINQSNLTPLEIQLAAYTFGVRIGLVSIDSEGSFKTDEYGRIVPEKEIYGPNTEELLLMGIWDSNKSGTYYGLYPKLNVKNPELLADPAFYQIVLNVENYWASIDMNKK